MTDTASGAGWRRAFPRTGMRAARSSGRLRAAAGGYLMAAMIGLALAAGVTAAARGAAGGTEGGGAPEPASLSLTSFSRDMAVFDTGAAFGRSAAPVPVIGTGALPGDVIEARVVTEAGAEHVAPVDIGQAGADGLFQGTIQVPRTPQWLHLEARVKGSGRPWVRRAHRFAAGHVLAYYEQSGGGHQFAYHDVVGGHPTLAAEDDVQVFYHNHDPKRIMIRNGTNRPSAQTPGMTHLADVLMKNRPGEKFAVVLHVQDGTNWVELTRDGTRSDGSANPRPFAADKALHNLATADGQQVGFIYTSWYHSTAGWGSGHGANWAKLALGRNLDGTAAAPPHEFTYGPALHTLTELYGDYSKTKWGWEHYDHARGGLYGNNINKSVRSTVELLSNPHISPFLTGTAFRQGWVFQGELGSSGFTDTNHPATDTVDGIPRAARGTALALLTGSGIVAQPKARIDQVTWAPDGSKVTLGSSQYQLSTVRKMRGWPAVKAADTPDPALYAEYDAEVADVFINDEPARNVTIEGGKIVVRPQPGQTRFTSADSVRYKLLAEHVETPTPPRIPDRQKQRWYDGAVAIPPAGVRGVETFPIQPVMDRGLFANTLPVDESQFTNAWPVHLTPTRGNIAMTWDPAAKMLSWTGNEGGKFASWPLPSPIKDTPTEVIVRLRLESTKNVRVQIVTAWNDYLSTTPIVLQDLYVTAGVPLDVDVRLTFHRSWIGIWTGRAGEGGAAIKMVDPRVLVGG